MSKLQMISDIVSLVNCNDSTKQRVIKRSLRKSKEFVENVYNLFSSDSSHALFYAQILSR